MTDTAALAAQMTDWLEAWRTRAVQSGAIRPFAVAHLTIFDDGSASLHAGSVHFGGHNTPLAETMRLADEWSPEADTSALNLTLGLTADGRFVEAA